MQHNNDIKVIIGSANPLLGKRICEHLQVSPCRSEVLHFSDGNTFVRILENIRGRDVFVVQGVSYPVNQNFMELLFWIDAMRLASARQITAVIPFFSYAKGDKKDEPRVSIRARACANALESVGIDRIVTMELHSPQIQGFFSKPVDHMHSRKILFEHIKARRIPDLVVASADVGYGKNAFKLAELLGVPTVIGNKIRKDHSENAHIWNVVGDVRGKNVLIVDDIIFTGGSLVSMSKAVKELGAHKVFAAATHGVLTPGANKKLDASDIEEMIITDTVEYRFEDLSSKVSILSVGELFAGVIHAIHNNASISTMFP